MGKHDLECKLKQEEVHGRGSPATGTTNGRDNSHRPWLPLSKSAMYFVTKTAATRRPRVSASVI